MSKLSLTKWLGEIIDSIPFKQDYPKLANTNIEFWAFKFKSDVEYAVHPSDIMAILNAKNKLSAMKKVGGEVAFVYRTESGLTESPVVQGVLANMFDLRYGYNRNCFGGIKNFILSISDLPFKIK